MATDERGERHWADVDVDAYAFSVSTCFVERVLRRMREVRCSRSELARRLGVARPRVTQMLRLAPPENMTVAMMAGICRALDMDLALVAYEQGEARSHPVSAEVFERCWQDAGRPPDFWKWHDTPPA